MVGQFYRIDNCLKVEVVDQARLADKYGEENIAGPRDSNNRLERVRVDNFRVIHRGQRLGFQHAAHHRLQSQRVAHARGQLRAGGLQRAMQNGGGAAFVGVQIGVARRKRQAVGLAYDRANHAFGVEIQIAHHLRDDAHLLRILAPEISVVRLDDLEQFHYDRGYAAKMAGTRAALEAVAKSLDGNVSAKAAGINFGGVG